ncbi:hypothetical protein IFR05_009850 [Cadophora sp. M221]|nr:hypothetical protein IFR05_009850 [Cadophora sp. M221]
MINPSLSPETTKVSLSIDEQVRQHGFEYADGHELRLPDNDPSHPRHWPFWTKAINTAVIISLDFFTTAVSTSGATGAKQGRIEYSISRVDSIFCYTSM